jgi:hypothetical protein
MGRTPTARQRRETIKPTEEISPAPQQPDINIITELAALKERQNTLTGGLENLELHIEARMTRLEAQLNEILTSLDHTKALYDNLETNRFPAISQRMNQLQEKIEVSRDTVLAIMPTRVREEIDVRFQPFLARFSPVFRRLDFLEESISVLNRKIEEKGFFARLAASIRRRLAKRRMASPKGQTNRSAPSKKSL